MADSALQQSVNQIFDKLVDMVVGPVQGTITSVSSVDQWLPQGQLATLPDGRVLRVTKATHVGVDPTPIPCRLFWLSPAYPAKSNFASIPANTVATWVDPPTNLATTGTTSEFVNGVQSAGLRINSVVEYERLENKNEEFAAGANGDTRVILFEPELNSFGGDHDMQVGWFEASWTVRFNFAGFGPKKDKFVGSKQVFDRLSASLLGATVGDDIVRFKKWSRVRRDDCYSWELTFLTRESVDGRVNVPPNNDNPAFDGIDGTFTLPNDTDQPSPFRVLTSTSIA